MLQTHTPGGEPTQSCREKGHMPSDHTEGTRPLWGTQHPSRPARSPLRTPRRLQGDPNPPPRHGVPSIAQPKPRAPSHRPHTDPVRHGPQQAVQVADQSFGHGAGLLHGQAGEGPAAVVEGEVAALGRTGGCHREGEGVMEGSQAGLPVSSHHVQNEDAGFPQDVGGHHLGGQSRGHSAGRGRSPRSPPPASPPGRKPLTVQPARALRCSAATSKALRVAPPLPRRAQGSSTARRSGGGRGPRPPLSRRASSSAKREAGGAEGWHPPPRRGERASASPAACLAGRRTRSRRAGR